MEADRRVGTLPEKETKTNAMAIAGEDRLNLHGEDQADHLVTMVAAAVATRARIARSHAAVVGGQSGTKSPTRSSAAPFPRLAITECGRTR